ncbi:uncharacterized protein ASCRUDRAFT_77042, partial [Ascoidea rubescens DSM 1968]
MEVRSKSVSHVTQKFEFAPSVRKISFNFDTYNFDTVKLSDVDTSQNTFQDISADVSYKLEIFQFPIGGIPSGKKRKLKGGFKIRLMTNMHNTPEITYILNLQILSLDGEAIIHPALDLDYINGKTIAKGFYESTDKTKFSSYLFDFSNIGLKHVGIYVFRLSLYKDIQLDKVNEAFKLIYLGEFIDSPELLIGSSKRIPRTQDVPELVYSPIDVSTIDSNSSSPTPMPCGDLVTIT